MAVVSIGSTLEDQRELDTTTVEKCDLIICDAPEEVMTETGDMIAANQANVSFHDKVISLNDLINGKANARIAAARLPMFKSVGTALQDITVAELAFDKALKANLGTVLPIRFKDKLA